MATSLKINAASFISPGDLAKAQVMLDRESTKSGEILMRTAAHSITSSIRKWASANSSSFQQDIDKALQPFLNSLEKQVVRTLGGSKVSALPHGVRATGGTPSSQTVVGGLVSPGVVDPNIFNMLTVRQQQNLAYQAQMQSLKQSVTGTASAGGGGGGRERGGGGAVGESIGIALTMETIHAMVEQISEVRNEMYDANIQASNLQRQMLIPIAPGNDIRNFTNAIADPGMKLGYTKQEALAAASTLALAGNSKSTAEAVSANEAMFKFSNRFGLEAPQWASILATGETAGLFGQGPGNLGFGGKGVEAYQARVAGLYGIASQSNGTPGNRGTGLGIDEFASSLNSLSQALGDATGNSEDAAKAFTNLGDKGNVFNMFTALERTNNQAFAGQGGVNLLMGVHSSIQNQVFGSPMQQAMAYATHPGMNMGQIFHAQSKGLTDPNEFRNQMKFINANYKGDDRELALHQLYGLSYGAGAALEQIYSQKGGRGATAKQLQDASNIMGYGEDSQAKVFRTAMDALTKSMEELAQFISPVVVGFDNLQGATHGLAGILLMTVGALKGKSFIEHLLGGGEGRHTKGLLGEIKELAKGKGQPVYVTNEVLRVTGNMGNNIQSMGKGLMGEAEAVGEGALPGVLPEAAAMGGVGELAGAGLAEGTGFAGAGLLGSIIGGAGELAGGALIAGGAIAGSPLLVPAAAIAGTAAAGWGITHPKQAANFIGSAANVGGQIIGGTVNAAGNVIGGTANALWNVASGATHLAFGEQFANNIGGSLKGVGKFFGDEGDTVKHAWHILQKWDVGKTTGKIGNPIGSVIGKFGQSIMKEGLLNAIGNPLSIVGDMFSSTKGSSAQEADRHKKETEKQRLDHMKATNKEWEKLLGKSLDPNNPISSVVKGTLTGDWSSFLKDVWSGATKFFKGFIKNLNELWNSLFGSNKAPTPVHSPSAPSTGQHQATSTAAAGNNVVTSGPIHLHLHYTDSHGHTSTKEVVINPLKPLASQNNIQIGPQHSTQPKR